MTSELSLVPAPAVIDISAGGGWLLYMLLLLPPLIWAGWVLTGRDPADILDMTAGEFVELLFGAAAGLGLLALQASASTTPPW